MRGRSCMALLALAPFLAPEAAHAGRASHHASPVAIRLFHATSDTKDPCKLCYDRQVGIFFFTYKHKFGTGAELFVNADPWGLRAPVHSLASWIHERTVGVAGPSSDDISLRQDAASWMRDVRDDDEGGDWVAVGYKECSLGSCHTFEEMGRCHEVHTRCGGESMEAAWVSAVAHAQRGEFAELQRLAAVLPARVRVDRSRRVASLLDCSGSGQVMLQDSIATISTAL